MAINNEYPLLDGIAPSWADLQATLTPYEGEALEIHDVAAINTGVSVEVGEQRGLSGGRVIRRTTGAVSYEVSVTFYLSGYQKFMRLLAATAPVRGNQKLISLVHFDLLLQHKAEGDEELYGTRLEGLRFMGRTKNATEGTDPDQVEVPMSCVQITDLVDGEEIVAL